MFFSEGDLTPQRHTQAFHSIVPQWDAEIKRDRERKRERERERERDRGRTNYRTKHMDKERKDTILINVQLCVKDMLNPNQGKERRRRVEREREG